MSTQSILSRLQQHTFSILGLFLGGLLISLQLVLPATTVAASAGYTFGHSPSLDRASAAVVRLVVNYSDISSIPTPSRSPEGTPTVPPTSTSTSGKGSAPTCSRTGLGTIVSSAEQGGMYVNYVLTDSSVVNPYTLTCTSNISRTSGSGAATISSIQIYSSTAYAGSTVFQFPLISCSNNALQVSMVVCTSASNGNSSVNFLCPTPSVACNNAAVLLSFTSPSPQPYLSVSAASVDTASFGIELNGPGLASFTPPSPTSAVGQEYFLPVPLARSKLTGSITNFDAGMPIVSSDGKSVLGMEPDFSGRTASVIPFVSGTIATEMALSQKTNQLQAAWATGITAYYSQSTNHFATAQRQFAAAAKLNPNFQGAVQFESLAKEQAQIAPTPQSNSLFAIPYWLLAIAGLVLIIVVLLLVSIAAARRRRDLAQFEKEQEAASRTAELEAQRISMEEASRRAEPTQEQQGQHGQAAYPAPSPFASPIPAQGLQAGSQQGPVDLRCPNCGYPFTKGDAFCSNCRAVLAPSESGYHVRMVQPPPSSPPVPNIQSPVLMPSPSISDMPTLEISPSQQSLAEETTVPGPGKVPYFNGHNVSIAAGSRSDPGIKRKQKPNEDSLLAVMGERTHNSLPQQFGLFVVADGMGGHANGQDASRLAIQTMVDRILPRLSSSEDLDDQALAHLLVDGVRQANIAVFERNMEHHADMGTTMTSAIVVGGMAYVANVGDSRTYMYREPEGLHKITHDHSVVASLVEAGIIRNEDIYTHPKRNQIYRSLGEKSDLEVDSFVEPLQPGDKLLLCSDGLWEMVHDRDPQRDKDIQRIMSISNADPKQTVNALINAANEGGGEDNISVIVVSVTEATSRTGMTGFHLLEKPETVQMPRI